MVSKKDILMSSPVWFLITCAICLPFVGIIGKKSFKENFTDHRFVKFMPDWASGLVLIVLFFLADETRRL